LSTTIDDTAFRHVSTAPGASQRKKKLADAQPTTGNIHPMIIIRTGCPRVAYHVFYHNSAFPVNRPDPLHPTRLRWKMIRLVENLKMDAMNKNTIRATHRSADEGRVETTQSTN
jgi:hypothetical protein